MKKNLKNILVLMLILVVVCACVKPVVNSGDGNAENNNAEVGQNSNGVAQPSATPVPTQDASNGDNQNENNSNGNENQTNGPTEADKQQGVVFVPERDDTVEDPNNERGLSTERFPFSFGAAKDGQPHNITVDNQKKFDDYNLNALAWDNKTQEKVLYLTFDCGYKYEDVTERMLDTLKEKNAKATFFCTLDFLKDDPTAVRRMIDEGHNVGNHTTTHPDCTTISREAFAKELKGVDDYMREHFDYSTKYFRFPTGAYSQNALDLANGQGYRSIFWSIAHADWDPENQPGVDVSFATVTGRLHPGAVILLHTCSSDNEAILGDLIDYARNQGYEFRSLDQYAYWT